MGGKGKETTGFVVQAFVFIGGIFLSLLIHDFLQNTYIHELP